MVVNIIFYMQQSENISEMTHRINDLRLWWKISFADNISNIESLIQKNPKDESI